VISFTVRMKFLPEDRAEIRSILQNVGAASRQEPGCVNYVTHVVESDPDTVVIYEQYKDAEALEAHRSSPHFEEWVANGLYRKLRERTQETLIEIV
jgi:quinol monooxygenase YgiN